jgi:hypothetical protein
MQPSKSSTVTTTLLPYQNREILLGKVEAYCKKYQKKCESEGLGTKYRTLRMVAKRFNVTLDEVEGFSHDSENLDLIVGFRVGGHGGPTGEYERSEQMLEYMGE